VYTLSAATLKIYSIIIKRS